MPINIISSSISTKTISVLTQNANQSDSQYPVTSSVLIWSGIWFRVLESGSWLGGVEVSAKGKGNAKGQRQALKQEAFD
jgi:hypothetical protein